MSFPIRLAAAVALTVLPAIASAAPRLSAKLHRRHARVARSSQACLKLPVELVSVESTTFALAKCDGTAVPAAVDRLSKLAGAPFGHNLDARLVEQLEAAVDHFRSREVPRVVLLSGYRPPSGGNYHSTGRALDFRIDGVEDEALFAFCKTLADTGCGYYPHSSFVHMDVRDPGTGHIAWTDMSKPGEPPRYVPSTDVASPSEPAPKDSSPDVANPSDPPPKDSNTDIANPSEQPRKDPSTRTANPSERTPRAQSADATNSPESPGEAPGAEAAKPTEAPRPDASPSPETAARPPLPPLPPPPRDTGRPRQSKPARDR
jgi:hypothetical protein